MQQVRYLLRRTGEVRSRLSTKGSAFVNKLGTGLVYRLIGAVHLFGT